MTVYLVRNHHHHPPLRTATTRNPTTLNTAQTIYISSYSLKQKLFNYLEAKRVQIIRQKTEKIEIRIVSLDMRRIALWTIRSPYNTLMKRIFFYPDAVPFKVIFNDIIHFKQIIKRIMCNRKHVKGRCHTQTKEEAKGFTFIKRPLFLSPFVLLVGGLVM